jgi:NADH-quinone oxidoreductase subunit E
MTVDHKDGQVVKVAVEEAMEKHGRDMDELIPILTDVNHALGYLPAQALDEISKQLRVPKSQLFSVASFYQMLSTKPRGRHVIQFCESAPCHVVGGRQVWEMLKEELDLNEGETTPDGRFTLITVSCLGVCGVGPVMVIDDDIFGNLEPGQLHSILARYQ